MLYQTCKFPHQLNILSRFPQKAKLAPIKEKCKSSRGRALKIHTFVQKDIRIRQLIFDEAMSQFSIL